MVVPSYILRWAKVQHALVTPFFPQSTNNMMAHPQLLRILSVFVLIAGPVLTGCNTDQQQRPVHMDFDAVFQPLDTVRLDHNVFLTDIRVVDISDAGEILLVDSRAARDSDLHMFGPSGSHIRKLTVIDCDPGASFWPLEARFVGTSRIVAASLVGFAFLFDENGRCFVAGRTEAHRDIYALCEFSDTIFSLQRVRPGEAALVAFSSLLVSVDSFQIQPPIFPWFHMGFDDRRRIGCFEDGPWYTFGESMDAIPLHPYEGTIRYRPHFFASPKRDAPPGNDIEGRFAVLREATRTGSVFELSTTTRLIVYRDGRKVGNHFDAGERGLMIAEHGENGYAVTTVSPYLPMAAKDGDVYFRGDPEQLPNGETGNWTLMRFRFLGRPGG